MSRVCSSCFEDLDLRSWIRENGSTRGCDFCHGFDSPTIELSEVCRRIETCLGKFWGLAVNQLPYESAEGGYQGQTWATAEVVFDEEGLSLPRDDGTLYDALLRELIDELWCDWDWLSLDDDDALWSSWELFCDNVKHKRRFFFHSLGGSPDDRNSYSAEAILRAIALLSESLGLIRVMPSGTRIWRARADIPRGKRVSPADFGPPPRAYSLQSNRMNPPGIPMMYAASTARTAKLETRATSAKVGQWRTMRAARVLDLRKLPEVPGTFSDTTRQDTLGLRFLWDFSQAIMSPVARDQRVHIDYLPSQVVTEYLRDFQFDSGKLDGIAYESTIDFRGWNLALFTEPIDLSLDPGDDDDWLEAREPWLEFRKSKRV